MDATRGLLQVAGQDIAIEPRGFALLVLLVTHHDRMVTKDEIVEAVWDGRIVSDAAIATVIKTTRKALGDTGVTQKYIRTVRGRGVRFVGTLAPVIPAEVGRPATVAEPSSLVTSKSRPSIAILPFRMVGYSQTFSAISDAIPAELISCLSRLRWLTVVSRGSTFRFRDSETDLEAVHSALGTKYCLTGLVEIFGAVIAVSVELSDTRSKAVVWSERFSGTVSDVNETRNDIVTHVISALELHVPLNEAKRARLRPPENLDAWSMYHLGLQHMYRFNKADNLVAASHFERATHLDPDFARAYAAQSFTSFQNAFLKYNANAVAEIDNARRFAEKAVELDPIDPFANFTLGRAHWLKSDPEAGMPWIDRAIELSPNFAQGFYAHGWGDVMAGRGAEALEQLQKAIALSPLDPFLYAMQSACGLACLQLEDYDNAVLWAEKGARAPGSHFLIGAIAAVICKINGDEEKAAHWAMTTKTRRPDASVAMFFDAFPFQDQHMRSQMTSALVSVGFQAD
ncbi:winged helix-turn-helix domain-containing protein [Sulfitobacter sp. TSTF-M16]|uniref:Winged helix-turn-helix domain-containing protein n=1 Tax=Sulfitobacter aestuariivivens TaxID=2766981 RepID=A0A927D493_9RHOB|nr:winged helix-turn-helix domain-containing protein [Sulfitobacter aestuariivivens]MBD3662566.1 winged helix-turn-helix domain-containing protein [Sulfitobacter aestuariivivens]